MEDFSSLKFSNSENAHMIDTLMSLREVEFNNFEYIDSDHSADIMYDIGFNKE
jgi:hypothetical protein